MSSSTPKTSRRKPDTVSCNQPRSSGPVASSNWKGKGMAVESVSSTDSYSRDSSLESTSTSGGLPSVIEVLGISKKGTPKASTSSEKTAASSQKVDRTVETVANWRQSTHSTNDVARAITGSSSSSTSKTRPERPESATAMLQRGRPDRGMRTASQSRPTQATPTSLPSPSSISSVVSSSKRGDFLARNQNDATTPQARPSSSLGRNGQTQSAPSTSKAPASASSSAGSRAVSKSHATAEGSVRKSTQSLAGAAALNSDLSNGKLGGSRETGNRERPVIETHQASTCRGPGVTPSQAKAFSSRPVSTHPTTHQRSQASGSSSTSTMKSRPAAISSHNAHASGSKLTRLPVCIDLTEDSPPPRKVPSQGSYRQAKLLFGEPKRDKASTSRSWQPDSSIVASRHAGSQDYPVVLTPTLSPEETSPPPPVVTPGGKNSSGPSIISISDSTSVSRQLTPGNESSSDSLPSLSQLLDQKVAIAPANSPPSTPERPTRSAPPGKEAINIKVFPESAAPRLRPTISRKNSSSSRDTSPPASPPIKQSKRLQDAQAASPSASPSGRSLRKPPASGFFTLPRPGSNIDAWPQHAKTEHLSSRKKAPASRAESVVSPLETTKRRVISKPKVAPKSKPTPVQSKAKISDDDVPIQRRNPPRQAPRMLEPMDSNEIVTDPRPSATVFVSLHGGRRAVTPPGKKRRVIVKTGSLDSPIRPSAGRAAGSPAFTRRTRQASSPLTLLPEHLRLQARSSSPEDPMAKDAGAAQRLFDFGEVIDTSVTGEVPLWSPAMRERLDAELSTPEPEEKEESDDGFEALDPDLDMDFFESLAQPSASVAVTAQPSQSNLSPAKPMPTPAPSSPAKADEAASAEAVKAERLLDMRRQIEKSARAAAQAEAEEATRIAAAFAAPSVSHNASDDLDDDLDEALAPRRSTRLVRTEHRGYSLTPEPEPTPQKRKVKKELTELDHIMLQIERKRKNGQTTDELAKLVAMTDDLTKGEVDLPSSSPSKRPRLHTVPIPYPTPVSAGDHTPTLGREKMSVAKMQALLGEDADLVHTLVASTLGTEAEASQSHIRSWTGFWNSEVAEQIGEPTLPNFGENPLLNALTDAAASSDSAFLVVLLDSGVATAGAQESGSESLVSTWLFELATLSRDPEVAASSFQALANLAQSAGVFGDALDLLRLLQNAIASFGARSTAIKGPDVMSYSMEASRKVAAAMLWVRLIITVISYNHLGHDEIRCLIPALVQLAMDLASPTSLKLIATEAITLGVSRCSTTEQANICADLIEMFSASEAEVHAAVVRAIGRSSEASRHLSRRFAAASLEPSSFIILDYASPLGILDIDECLLPVRTAIEQLEVCETEVAALVDLLSETLTDVEGLIPNWQQKFASGDGAKKRSGIDSLVRKMNKLHNRINDQKGENIALSEIKSHLYHLSVSLDRQQFFFERKHKWTGSAGGLLAPGVGGQTKLSFGGRA